MLCHFHGYGTLKSIDSWSKRILKQKQLIVLPQMISNVYQAYIKFLLINILRRNKKVVLIDPCFLLNIFCIFEKWNLFAIFLWTNIFQLYAADEQFDNYIKWSSKIEAANDMN